MHKKPFHSPLKRGAGTVFGVRGSNAWIVRFVEFRFVLGQLGALGIYSILRFGRHGLHLLLLVLTLRQKESLLTHMCSLQG